jgi:hypothetical protein
MSSEPKVRPFDVARPTRLGSASRGRSETLRSACRPSKNTISPSPKSSSVLPAVAALVQPAFESGPFGCSFSESGKFRLRLVERQHCVGNLRLLESHGLAYNGDEGRPNILRTLRFVLDLPFYCSVHVTHPIGRLMSCSLEELTIYECKSSRCGKHCRYPLKNQLIPVAHIPIGVSPTGAGQPAF